MGRRDVYAERFTAQALSGEPLREPAAVAGRLLAVQAQDARGARLAIRARSSGLTAADVDRELTESRALLVSWLNRGTLHLVRAEDYPWLHALTTPPLFTGNARRLAQEGVPLDAADRGVTAIGRALAEEGPLTRAELRERLRAAGIRTEGQAMAHLLMLATLRGVAVRGPVAGPEQAYALLADWLGELAEVDRDTALAELARRYLRGHAPADDRDLARWAGLPLRDVRRGLERIAPELEEGADGLLRPRRDAALGEIPPPRLLGAYDPLLLGWVSREEIVGPHRTLVTDNGLFRPFALVEGRAVGRWRWAKGRVDLEPLEDLSAEVRAALDAEAADVARFLG